MAKSYRRVHQLASKAQLTTKQVLTRLRTIGITVTGENDLVPKARHRYALNALDLHPITYEPTASRKPPSKSEDGSLEGEKTPDQSSEVKPEPRHDLVGHRANEIVYLNADEVEEIHWILVDDFKSSQDPIKPPGVQSRALLESAVFRAETSLGSEPKYPTVPMSAAAYLHSLILNHPFHNGNKRTALVSLLVFLDLNGYLLRIEQNALFDYLIAIASHDVITEDDLIDDGTEVALADAEVRAIANWVHSNSRATSKEEKILKFHQLRSILLNYNCRFEQPSRGNRINIFRDQYRTQVYYRNEGTDVPRNTIRKIRRDLHLMYEDGYDSTIFYDTRERIPTFINHYRKTLSRLAKV